MVVSDLGQQVTEAIQDETNGLLVTPGDASALATALKRLIGGPALRSRLGQQVPDFGRSELVMRTQEVS